MKRVKIVWLILIIVGIILLLNIGGLIIELLFGLGLIHTDLVKIRSIGIVNLISFMLIISGIIFWINLFKLRRKAILWWNIFLSFGILNLIFNINRPTMINNIIPYYIVIALGVMIIIWGLVFFSLRKILS